MSLALSICLLLISLIQLVNGGQFLNATPLSLSSARQAAALSPAPVIVIFPLTRIYASLQSHKLDFSIAVLNLIWLLTLYVPLDSSLISIQFFVLNLEG